MGKDSLTECFTNSFLARKEKTAITFLRNGRVETQISYLELERDANRMANFLLELGVVKGDRVILFVPKSLILMVAHLALQKIGAITVPLNSGFKQSEMHYLLADAQARLILLDPDKEAFIKVKSLPITATFQPLAGAGMVNQYPPHRLRTDRHEMRLAFPLHPRLINHF